jgi:uncharacterized protein YcaQ
MDVAAEDARRFLVIRQLLAPARSVEGGPDGVLEIFRRLGSIQFDPLSVAFLPPFDPLVWDRGLLGSLFGFVDAMQAALGAYLQFAGASRLEWAPHLSTERRLFP